MTKSDVKLCEKSGYPIMGINNAYQMTNKLTYLYGCDIKWWRKHYEMARHVPNKYILEQDLNKMAFADDVVQLLHGGDDGLSHEWPKLKTGKNGGYQAINLTYLLEYNRHILLGYDMQEIDGKVHWHGLHEGLNNPSEQQFKEWRGHFDQLAQELKAVDVEVLNATRQTALECFPRVRLEDALNEST